MKLWINRILVVGALSGALSAEDTFFTSYHFMGSDNCSRCHNGMTDNQGKDMSIETAWSATMMANSSKDPLWRAKVRSEIDRHPHLEGVLNDKCTRCHAPMANVEAHHSGHNIEVFDGGFLSSNNTHHDEALNGVSCTLCHQIKENGDLGTLAGMSGGYEINGNRIINGQYGDVFAGPMINNVDYQIQQSAHISASKMCATCHNLKTPFVDENGNVLSTTPESEFPEQMPYSEWEHSDFADSKSCQECHMKRADGVVMATRPPWLETQRNNFAQHMFVGGNKTLLDILKNNKSALEVTSNNFDETIAESDAMLKSAATIEVVENSLANGTLEVTLKVNSTTGHKLPTSFPSRRAFMHLKVTDASGSTVFESGRVNADGSIVGANADSDSAAYEPHYDVITSEDEVQIYESIMQNNQGAVTYTLLRGAAYKKDNRILPRGFDKTTAHSDIRVVGGALNDDDFVGGSDTITYRVSGLQGGNYSVDAELLYQSVSYAFAQDLYRDNSAESNAFKTMFNASPMKTSQIATATFDVSGSGGSAPAACGDGLDNDGDGLVDLADPGCSSTSDNDEYNEVTPPAPAACNDGVDNDGDGLVDLADPGCSDTSDDDEYNEPLPQCSDGIDNDGDGKVDMNDPSCSGPSDDDEYYPKRHRGGH
jgi:hypothetical protein